MGLRLRIRNRLPPADPRRAVLYARVSTEEQANEGISIQAQEAAMRRYCEQRGLTAVEVVRELGVSASVPLAKRPGGARVLALLDSREAGCVVAIKLDRLFRDAHDCLGVTKGWDNENVAMHLIEMSVDTTTAMGRLFLIVLAGVAESERGLISERTKAALAHLRSQGVRPGPARFGYEQILERDQHGRRVAVPIEVELETIRRARDLRAEGRSLRAIAEALTAEGRTTKRGGRWFASTVRGILAT